MKKIDIQKGFSLMELVVSIGIVMIFMASVFMVTRFFRTSTNQLVGGVNQEAYAINFIKAFTEEIGSAGNSVFNSSITSAMGANEIVLGLNCTSRVTCANESLEPNANPTSETVVTRIDITQDLDEKTRQTVVYTYNSGIINKTKILSNGSDSETVYKDQPVLKNVEAFKCSATVAGEANFKAKALACLLTTTATSGAKASYRIYAMRSVHNVQK